MSNTDFILGSKLPGSFVGKGEILKVPLLAQFAKSAKFIGIRRKSKYNAESRGKLIQAFNGGQNTIMFPEATTTDGDKVYLFHAGLMTLLFGDKAVDKKQRDVALKNEVVVQPVAVQVKSVNGQDATNNPDLRYLYSMRNEGKFLKRLWKRFQVKNITLELTAFDALNPKDFAKAGATPEDLAKDLANAAACKVAEVINPGQTEFENAFKPETWANPPSFDRPEPSVGKPKPAQPVPPAAT
jgi:1-acyl-sn-glycerol-3-phosphate acyltransferase